MEQRLHPVAMKGDTIMKRTFTLTMMSMLLALTSFAGHNHKEGYYANGSSLELRLMPHGTYTVVMNGVRYYDVGDLFEVSGLTAGTHQIRIIEHYGRRHHGQVVYNGYINIPYQSNVVARVTPHNRIMIQHVHRIPAQPRQRYNPHDDYRRGNGHHRGNGNGRGQGNRYRY